MSYDEESSQSHDARHLGHAMERPDAPEIPDLIDKAPPEPDGGQVGEDTPDGRLLGFPPGASDMPPTQRAGDHSQPLQTAVQRARAEFLEMPGLRITAAQAGRLWTLDAALCDAVLSELLAARLIRRTAGDAYIRND